MSRSSRTPSEPFVPPFAGAETIDELRGCCVSYLSGTLPVEEAAKLESRFADPAVAKILEQESEWLLRTTMAVSAETTSMEPATSILAARQSPNPVPSKRRLLSVIATLAATVLLAIPLTHRPANESFEMQVARAYAEPSMNWESDSESLPVDDSAEWQSELEDADWETTDESLQWMLVAVEPILIDQEDNDG
ncbi:MAG: hypothetical protein AAGJ83_02390 [Planctomycetota bacterium]